MTFYADQCCSLDFNDTNGFYGSDTNPVLSEQDESPLGEFYPWKVFCHKSGECQQGAYKTIRQQPKTTPGTGWISCQLRVYEFLASTFLVFISQLDEVSWVIFTKISAIAFSFFTSMTSCLLRICSGIHSIFSLSVCLFLTQETKQVL